MFGKNKPKSSKSSKPKTLKKQGKLKSPIYLGRCNKCHIVNGHTGQCPVIS